MTESRSTRVTFDLPLAGGANVEVTTSSDVIEQSLKRAKAVVLTPPVAPVVPASAPSTSSAPVPPSDPFRVFAPNAPLRPTAPTNDAVADPVPVTPLRSVLLVQKDCTINTYLTIHNGFHVIEYGSKTLAIGRCNREGKFNCLTTDDIILAGAMGLLVPSPVTGQASSQKRSRPEGGF